MRICLNNQIRDLQNEKHESLKREEKDLDEIKLLEGDLVALRKELYYEKLCLNNQIRDLEDAKHESLKREKENLNEIAILKKQFGNFIYAYSETT